MSREYGATMAPDVEQDMNREKKFGANVTVRNFWIRHSQKQSGEVFNTGKTGISASSISAAGAERASAYGETINPQSDVKGYVSDSTRTNETLESIVEGIKKHSPETGTGKVRVKEELVGYGPAEWLKLYDSKWSTNKAALLAEQGLKLEDFSTLSPDEQERIAEEAEEPVIREWLDNPQSGLAQLHPPRHPAARFAALFNRRHDRLAAKLNSDSQIDITHVTHKTVTEPFLTSGVLIDKSSGKKITTLEQLGGSLRILNSWESDVQTNEQGQAETIVRIRNKEYMLDNVLMDQLAEEGVTQLKDSGRDVQNKAQKKLHNQ